MNRNVVSGIAAFALLVGAALAMNESSAYAGNCGGGLFSKLHANKACGGGLFAKLKARHASSCSAPEPVCCEPAPEPCCEPAPAPCCEPAPAPCCEAAPECGGCGEAAPACGGCGEAAPVAGEGCASCGGDGGSVMMTETIGSDAGFDLAPGESVVPGSVQTLAPEATSAAKDAVPVDSASDAAGDAPPAPAPDADTNI